MKICTSKLAFVPAHAIGQRKAPFILLEHFRLSKRAFRGGFAWDFRRGVRRSALILPIVPLEPPKLDGYGSRYPNPKWDMNRPMSSTPLDLV